jgi:phosphate transport system substrate-binding protein
MINPVIRRSAGWRLSGYLFAFALPFSGLPSTASWAQNLQKSEPVSLHGAGSNFAAPLYTKWIEEYGVAHRNVSISYDSVGSGEGVRRFVANAVDFAGSDEILTESESSKLREAALMLPITAGMIALANNIPGVTTEIKLPRDVYVDIFAGVIRQWDDPRIQKANPGLAFPHRDIAIVARQDSSGTTAAFTKHLAADGPGERDKGMGVGKMIACKKGTMIEHGNEGCAWLRCKTKPAHLLRRPRIPASSHCRAGWRR